MDPEVVKRLMSNTVTVTGDDVPDFMQWLWDRHQTSPSILKSLCKQTARFGSGYEEYEKCMEWLRRRYFVEKKLMNELIQTNPFKEDDNNGI